MATVFGAEIDNDGQCTFTFRPQGEERRVRLTAARVIDCRGIRRTPEHHASPLVADLLATGQARVDALRISLDVSGDSQIIARNGAPSRRILAIGPASRAALWEITAISDIRDPVARLVDAMAAGLMDISTG